MAEAWALVWAAMSVRGAGRLGTKGVQGVPLGVHGPKTRCGAIIEGNYG